MFKRINLSDFRDEFRAMGRADQFSYEGLEVLFDYLEELEHCEEPYELDVIALCCDFAEADAFELSQSYDIDLGEYAGADTETDDDAREAILNIVREFLEDEGVLVGQTDSGAFVYHQF